MRLWHTLRIDGRLQYWRLNRQSPVHSSPNPQPEIYEAQVSRLLRQMDANPVGSAVLNAVCSSSRIATIVPLRREFNAFASPEVTSDDPPGLPLHSMAAGIPVRDSRGLMHRDGRAVFGVGGGADVKIYFTPGTFMHGIAGATPDATLCHELFHSMRAMHGRLVFSATGDHFDMIEEFWAVLIENTYLSQGGSRMLRASHHDFLDVPDSVGGATGPNRTLNRRGVLEALGNQMIDSPFDDMNGGPTLSQRFAAEHRSRILSLAHDEPDLCSSLRNLHGRFNPIRDVPQ